jgi:hypothetical protein
LSGTSRDVTDGAEACPEKKNVKRIAILQSNYIPWKGYFDIINSVDEFVIYDEAQYTRRDWRNRNIIKTKHGLKWLTIPVLVKGRFKQKISETHINQNSWAEKHWKTLKQNYSTAYYFLKYKNLFEGAYIKASNLKKLTDVNMLFLELINTFLGIETKITSSTDYNLYGTKTEKIISVCKQAGALHYFTGAAAKSYIDVKSFIEAGITLTWVDYEDYKVYNQLNPPFEHRVSIVDLIFNEGKNAKKFMKSFK